jgi:hypothetical protein
LFEHVVIAIPHLAKRSLFTIEERLEIVREIVKPKYPDGEMKWMCFMGFRGLRPPEERAGYRERNCADRLRI